MFLILIASSISCAVLSDNHSNMQRHIPGNSSISTAEAKAIDLALDFISTCDTYNKAMNHTSSKNPQIQKLRKMVRAFGK